MPKSKTDSPRRQPRAKAKTNGANLGFEEKPWQAADPASAYFIKETTVRRNVSIDWTVKESVRANLRRLARHADRVLRHHGYPPDKAEQATLTVLEQAEVIAKDWVVTP